MLTERDPTDDVPVQRRRRWRPVDRGLLVASAAIAIGLVLIIWGLSVAVTGDEGRELPGAVESVSPPPNAEQIPAQTAIFVDLQSGYEASMRVDDVEIPVVSSDDFANNPEIEPGEQVKLPPVAIYERGNATISFTPGDGAPIDELDSGPHQVTIVYYKSVDGPDKGRTFSWDFNVL